MRVCVSVLQVYQDPTAPINLPQLSLSAERLSPSSVVALVDGTRISVWIGRDVSRQFLERVRRRIAG